MQTFVPPDECPFQGLVASRIETYGGRYQASNQGSADRLHSQVASGLVSPGCPKSDLGGAGGRIVRLSHLSCSFMRWSIPVPHPYLLSWVSRESRLVLIQALRTPHPSQADG